MTPALPITVTGAIATAGGLSLFCVCAAALLAAAADAITRRRRGPRA